VKFGFLFAVFILRHPKQNFMPVFPNYASRKHC